MIRRLVLCAALVLSVRAADPYPAGTVTRIYAGDVSGSVLGFPQSATAQAELTGTPADFASTSSAAFIVRGMFVSGPAVAGPILGKWSNYIRVTVTGHPFRAVASWQDGSGLVMAYHEPDWSTITAQATGSVVDLLSVSIGPSTLALVETRTNAAPVDTNTPANADAINLDAWQSLGKHSLDPRKIAITRALYSAENSGDTVAIKYEPLGWSTETGGNGKTIDGAVCIAWRDGATWTGGHFDWHGVGQTTKTQANIPGGYLDGKQPPRGAPVYYFLVNRERKERTNIVPGGNW